MAEADPFPNQTKTAETTPAAQAASDHAGATRSKRMRTILMILGPVAAVAGGLWYWFGNPGVVETDNAYIKQDIVAVAGEITGLITQVKVRDNQHVKAGDVLFTIDPSTFAATVQQADAQIATAQARVTALNADVAAKAADLAAAGDDLALAQANLAREKALMDKGFNTRARMDAAEHAVAVARDKIVSIRAEVEQARAELANGAQVPGVNPAIAAAQANRAKATLDIERTVVRAPADGVITQVSRLQVGQMVFPGVPMLSIVRDGSARVEANFKETDLNHMRPGQPAEIEIDAYPGLRLKGHVDSIGAGTGSEFSVLPAQNATGNWVKVIQRVPVRIAIDSKSERPLIAGLSSDVTVHVGK
ncbi:HlyD family secretion protein [Novosphingobium taihuense]|uniref:Membrane fusion protein (Multidrug efflux system) n=1 Tax=Novosphingobium taihuense TaxID=260085 RepID=A0A7W7ABE6_9SPHN|nr:HlyD family secretion protein [Novosphingobium taihuense]MBB4613898.1 membrane fusion protein (multidrug efflux system) [Novosphingobium taihuense]TWH86749.1 membrane fusion protein (multidrug efflux system) [Novosphingobium taihuense]